MKRTLMGGALLILFASVVSITLNADSSLPGHSPQMADDQPSASFDHAALARLRFLEQNPGAAIYNYHDRVRRVYGKSFSHGQTPEESALQFIEKHIGMFGISPPDLVARGPFPGKPERHLQPIMYLPDEDRYRFTGVYFDQEIDGVPVFRARTMFLTRNEPNHPLVLVSADLRDLGDFRVVQDQLVQAEAGAERARRMIAGDLRAEVAVVGEAELVVWAGLEDMDVPPRLAVKQIVEVGTPVDGDDYQKWLYLVDALNGVVLYRENLVINCGGGTIHGNVSCMATEGDGADVCGGLVMQPMPYARIHIGTGPGQVIAFADENGDYAVTPQSGLPVTVSSRVRGQYFRVFNQGGAAGAIDEPVENLPAELDFLFDPAPFPGGVGEELHLAEINAYLHSNIVRDYALLFNPSYPVIANQTEFTVNVNIDNSCNAFYNGTSINFYTSGNGCSNSAHSTIVYHEYGHHLVNTGGSGQGAYGEGMSDAVAVLITENPILAIGFHNNCNAGIRNANNNMQYPCSGGIHFCGQLMSGSVWSTRAELLKTHPSNYMDILANLTINSILLHTGTSIDPSITIDFLTLDDDDDNIFNGTPHYAQIQAGFSKHNMPGPVLPPLYFEYPNGLPGIVAPGQETVIRVEVIGVTSAPVDGEAMLHYRADSADPFTALSMVHVAANVYDAHLPAADCGAKPEFYFSALDIEDEITLSETFTRPVGNAVVVMVEENFDQNVGWISGAPDDDATTGHWEWGNPVGTSAGGQQAQPNDCFMGQFCWFTGQHPGGGAGANDVDNGKTTLISPVFDLSDAADARIGYQRWYSNHAGANPHNDIFVVDISNDGGTTWTNVEVVGPSGPQASGGWYRHEFFVAEIVSLTDQVRLRFIASDYDPQALVEAAIDNVVVEAILCEPPLPPKCTADLIGSGDVGVADLLALLAAWGPCAPFCPADLTGDGEVGVADLLELLSQWGPCPD